jgi:hypothetical protein
MHEIAMHIDHNIDDFRPPFLGSFQDDDKAIERPTAAQIDALTACLTSIHGTLDIMSQLNHDVVVCLPTIFFARTAYAFVALLKLYSAISRSDSLGQVFAPADLRVAQYLEKVITHLKVSGTMPAGRTSGKFCTILHLLNNWFINRREQENPDKSPKAPSGSQETRNRNVGPPEFPFHTLHDTDFNRSIPPPQRRILYPNALPDHRATVIPSRPPLSV